jgi:hypothetical protein
MSFWKQLPRATRFHILFFSTILGLGLFCFLFARYGASAEARQFVLGLGIALIPAGIIGLAHRLFFYDELREEMSSVLSTSLRDAVKTDLLPFIESGIVRVSRNRNEMMDRFKEYVSRESGEVIIIGSSLKGILDPEEDIVSRKEFADILRNRMAEGVPCKFLLTHPSLAFLREDAEGRAPGDIKQEIINALRYLTRQPDEDGSGLPGLGVPYSNIKLYKGTPTIFSIITSNTLFINPYTYQSNAYDSLCIEVRKVGTNDLYSSLMSDHFHKPWRNEPRTTETLTQEMLERLATMTLVDVFEKRINDVGILDEARGHQLVAPFTGSSNSTGNDAPSRGDEQRAYTTNGNDGGITGKVANGHSLGEE